MDTVVKLLMCNCELRVVINNTVMKEALHISNVAENDQTNYVDQVIRHSYKQ